MGTGELTSTSYAVLGLLALRPATPYELAKQVQRSLRYFWPRAERKLYDEPRRLVSAGYAKAKREHVGRRGRTVYSITPAGRRALKRWLAQPPQPLVLESEALLKVFLSEQGTVESLRSTLETMRDQVRDERAALAAMAGATLRGETEFPERVHVNALGIRFAADFITLVDAWAAWALDEIDGWPDAREAAKTWQEPALDVFDDVSRGLPPRNGDAD